MTSNEQRAALQRQIWAIANDVRGAVDGWDFKQYVLGTLFYRFISENFIDYITGGDASVHYAAMADVKPTRLPAKPLQTRNCSWFHSCCSHFHIHFGCCYPERGPRIA